MTNFSRIAALCAKARKHFIWWDENVCSRSPVGET